MPIENKEYYSGRYILYSDGRLFSKNRGIFIKISPDVLGYACCNLYDGKRYTKHRLHRMMAESFLTNDNPLEKTQVNHIDGNRMNYNLDNLEWCTSSENLRHAHLFLSRISTRKLSFTQIEEILASELNAIELAKIYPVTARHIKCMKRGLYIKEYLRMLERKERIEKE